jgi:hypothetical protein
MHRNRHNCWLRCPVRSFLAVLLAPLLQLVPSRLWLQWLQLVLLGPLALRLHSVRSFLPVLPVLLAPLHLRVLAAPVVQ